MPVITTLHTVLQTPSPGQMAVLKRIAQISDRLIVMSRRAEGMLQEIYGVPREKIVRIHHGIPDVPFVDPNYYKDQFGVEGRKVILTFGLISPGKGIETMIDALPRVVKENPSTAYIVLGATHPHVKREQGEAYRHFLEQRAQRLGVGEHIIFHNRFVELSELCEFLGAADLYVTPYVNREQIVSGTLAYALGSGKAIISTPYWYAEEMLAENRGRIVPFHDERALAEQINDLFAQEVERHAMRKRAYTFCRQMVWKEVARKYLQVFGEVKQERENKPRAVFSARGLGSVSKENIQPKLDHLMRLTDDVGILQHAKFIVPDRVHGYCTDDNARALIAVLMAQEAGADGGVTADLACKYLAFLHHAFDEKRGRFRNFMGFDRTWRDEEGSQDSHSRAVWGLGKAVTLSSSTNIQGAAVELFERALPALTGFDSPRSWAFGLVGIYSFMSKYGGASGVRRIQETLADRLYTLYLENATEDWPWLEDTVNYSNGKIAQALLMSGQMLQKEEMIRAGLKALDWLVKIQTDATDGRGHFVPIGNKGWFRRGGEKARFDQQPVEAQSMIEACAEAYRLTSDPKWIHHAQWCLDWFLGRNDLNVPLYDYQTGGCCDGLGATGPNRNQGAESALAWLLSILILDQLRKIQVSMENQEMMTQTEKKILQATG